MDGISEGILAGSPKIIASEIPIGSTEKSMKESTEGIHKGIP